MNQTWDAMVIMLCLNYDTSQELLPQFKSNMDTLTSILMLGSF